MKLNTEEKVGLLLIVGFFVFILLIAFIQPHFEKRAFNKFSKQKATYWDALFSELRIEANRASEASETSEASEASETPTE